jgi:hypothetical protein
VVILKLAASATVFDQTAFNMSRQTRTLGVIDMCRRIDLNPLQSVLKHFSRSLTGTGRGVKIPFLVLAATAACITPRDAAAALAHRYSFSGNANDSVGTAHGTVVDFGVPTAVFANGELDLSANTGEGSNAVSEDAYVDLPNGLITEVANSGTSGAFSFELWATVAVTRTWQRYVDVGTSNGGEDTSPGGETAPYLYITANSGRFGNGVATEVHEPNQTVPAIEVGQTGPLPNNVQQHIVGTYDQTDTSAGPTGTFKLYRNGSLIGAGAIPAGLDLKTFTNDNNWLGRSQWNDPIFDGRFNEFRIYDHALAANNVAANTFLGPDVLSDSPQLLTLSVNKNSGAITLTNSATVPLTLDFYRISSAGSALNPTAWNSLDDQNYDAVDGPDAGTVAGDAQGEGWDQAGGTAAGQLVELFLGENGSSIGPSETLNLGNAFNTSIFGAGNDGDLVFSFGRTGSAPVPGTVTYVSGPAGVAGDYNNNGTVDAADYVLWRNGGPLQNEGATPGNVTADDYTFWRSRFGAQAGSGAGANAAVPEPGAVWIPALIALAGLFRGRRTSFNSH